MARMGRFPTDRGRDGMRRHGEGRSATAVQLGAFEMNTRPLMIGAVLVGAGALIGAAGLVLGGTVIVAATRRWVDQLDTPPAELARQKWAQARAATTAGASAWQNGVTAGSRNS